MDFSEQTFMIKKTKSETFTYNMKKGNEEKQKSLK